MVVPNSAAGLTDIGKKRVSTHDPRVAVDVLSKRTGTWWSGKELLQVIMDTAALGARQCFVFRVLK